MSDQVQYRNPDTTIGNGNQIQAKGDAQGRTVVTGDAAAPVPITPAPADLSAYGRVVYRSPAPTFYENEANVAAAARVLEIIYVQLGKVLTNAGIDLYVLIIDKNGAVAVGDGSAAPTPYLARAGEMIEWEPPDGFLFNAGIRVIVSTDPNIYAAPGAAEPISVMCRTRDP